MGLRQPGDTKRRTQSAQIRPSGFRPIPSGVDGRFLNTIERGINLKNRQEQQRIKFIKALFENDADISRIQAEQNLSNQEGFNAMEEAPSIKQQYLSSLNERFSEIPEQYRNNPDLRLSLIKKTNQFDRFSIPYVNQEARGVQDKAFNSRVANDVNTVVENAADLDYMERSGIPQVEESLYNKLSRQYGEDPNRKVGNTTVGELIMNEMRSGVSDTLTRSVQQQVMVNDFDTARKTVEKFYDRITPEDRLKVKKMIEKGLSDRKSDRALTLVNETYSVLGEDATLIQIEEYMRAASGSDGDLYNKALSMAEGRQKIIDGQKKRDYERIEGDVYEAIINGQQYSQEEFNRLPPDRQDKVISLVNKNNGGRAVVTDTSKYVEITNAIDVMPPEDFIAMDIDKAYGMYLSAEDRNTLKTRQNQIRREINKDYRDGQRWTPSVYKNVASTYAQSQDMDRVDRGKVLALAEQEYARLMEENPRMSRTEQIKRIKKALWERGTETEVEPPMTIFGFEIPFTGGDESTSMAESLSPERDMAIDPSWVRSVQQDRIQRGLKPMGERELMDFFKFLQTQNPNINLALPPK